jgi:hypothetical protein
MGPGCYHRRPAGDARDVFGEDAGHCVRDARAPHLRPAFGHSVKKSGSMPRWQMVDAVHGGRSQGLKNKSK